MRKIFISIKDGMSGPADWFHELAVKASASFTMDPKDIKCPDCQKAKIDGACHNPSCPSAVPPGEE